MVLPLVANKDRADHGADCAKPKTHPDGFAARVGTLFYLLNDACQRDGKEIVGVGEDLRDDEAGVFEELIN